MALKAGVERDVEYCGVVHYQPVRCTLESQALRVLLQCFTDGGSEQAVKVKRRELRLALPALQAIDPDRGWPGCGPAQAAASLFRFQKLYPLACLYSFSNRSRIVGLANVRTVFGTIASIGKMFLTILAVDVFGLAVFGEGYS